MAEVVRSTGMAVEVECSPAGERQRPGDIMIPGWRRGKPLAVDFAITARTTADAPDQIAHTKSVRYNAMCQAEGWTFLPCVGDSFGAVRGEGGRFLKQLCKLKAEKVGKSWPTPQSLFWQGMATCLVRRAAGAIADAWSRGGHIP